MLFVKKIVEEDLSNVEAGETERYLTELVEVKKAIERLNGDNKTAVVLKRDEKNLMVIGGGKDGKYVVTAYVKGKAYHMTNKFNVPKAAIELSVGGEVSTYASKRCVNLEMVLESAKHYADRGSLAQTFDWETH